MARPLFPLLFLLTLTLGAGGCATNPVSGGQDFVLMSEPQEVSLGRQEHPNILKQFGLYEDQALTEYVSRIGQEIAARSHRDHLQFHFTVLDSDQVNAFALPGGYIYVTRGLLAYLNSEAELAAVLGHEIGHVTARHGVRQHSAATATGLGVAIGSILVPELRGAGAQDLMNVLGTALLRGYGREHELEADRLGAEYLARAGYSPEAMLDVIAVLKNQEIFEKQLAKEQGREPRAYHGVFATHPRNDDRLQTVVRAARRLQPSGQVRPAGREGFLTRVDGLVFGPGADQGILHGARFYHRDLDVALDLPEGWTVENRADRLLAIAPGEVAVLQVTLLPRGNAPGPEAILREQFGRAELEQAGPIRAGALEGYTAVTTLEGPYGNRPTRVAVVLKGDDAFLFVGTSHPEQSFRAYDSRILASARSTHRLTADERKLAEPRKLRIIRADGRTTYPALAEKSRLRDHAEERLRLLNDHYPNGEPQAGQRLKIVE